jgi:uncharacterized protein
MTDTKAERLAAALNDFISSSPDVEAAAVVSFDGLAMASALPPDMDEDRLGAMSAALLSLGEQAAGGLGRGELNQVFVEGEHGFVFLMSARDQAVLAAVTSKQAKIGLMLFEMRRSADEVGRLLEPRGHDAPVLTAVEPVEEAPSPLEPMTESAEEILGVAISERDGRAGPHAEERELAEPLLQELHDATEPDPHEILSAMDHGGASHAPWS